ncbi:MAG TPA: delta-60 repeat domain-containing protein [Terriglobales bacterium]|nr:delta-60 repeat domain-containing protein [Terriglobales bacterium]
MKSRLCFPSILTRVVVFTFPWLLAGAVAAGHAQTIDGNFSEWSSAEIIGTDPAANVNPTDVADWLTLWATFQNGNLLLSYQTVQNIDFNNNAWRYEVLLDTDSNPLTGYRGASGNYKLGADYMVEGGTIYRYTGTGTNWSWSYVGTASYAISGNRLEMAVPGASLGITASIWIKIQLVGNNAAGPDFVPKDIAGFSYPRDQIVLDCDFSPWSGINPLGTIPAGNTTNIVDWTGAWALSQNGTFYLSYTTASPIDFTHNGSRYNLLLDTDNNPNTGYVGLPGGAGAEYLIQGGNLYRYAGTGTNWAWTEVTPLTYCVSGNQVELEVNEQYLGVSSGNYTLGIRLFGDNPTTWDLAPAQAPGFETTLVNVPKGELDPAFGSGGRVMTNFSGGNDSASGVAIQSNGDIVVVGTTSNPAGTQGTNFAVARYLPNGTLDTSFAGTGKVSTDFFGANDSASGVAIQSNGNIVVVGTTTNPKLGTGTEFALARYLPNGTLDPSFGDNGEVANSFLGASDVGAGLAIQSNGQIVVVGNDGGGGHSVLARYNSNGSLDTSFGTGGYVSVSNPALADALALQADGKIVVASVGLLIQPGVSYGSVGRFNPDGSVDTTFGTSGVTAFPGAATAVALLPSGNILSVGWVPPVANTMVGLLTSLLFGELNPDGQYVAQLSSQYIENVPYLAALAVQSDGEIVAVGSFLPESTSSQDLALTRFNDNLGFDYSFSPVTGLVYSSTVPLSVQAATNFPGYSATGSALALQANGDIVAVGTVTNAQGGTSFLIARYR